MVIKYIYICSIRLKSTKADNEFTFFSYWLSTLAKELTAATRVMQSSSN